MSEAPEGMISVEEFAKIKGISSSKVIDMIRDGFYVGRKVGDEWFVTSSESTQIESKPSNKKASIVIAGDGSPSEVVVTDIRMSFVSMVIFMVKWVIASIPAFIIIIAVFLVFIAVSTAIFGGVSGAFGS